MKNTTYQTTFEILGIERLRNSYYGNPRYLLILKDSTGRTRTAKTTPNGSIGYEICDSWINTSKTLKYHYTKNLNMVITYNVK